MPNKNRELVQGTLEMLILKTLALEPLHGYAIAMRIGQISEGVFRVGPGSLFPAFNRLESAGHIGSEWRATENNRRAKYYRLTSSGRKALKLETHTWEQQTAAITRILEA
jgi:PadR family transcriptional regulator, regulatory protein PadR